MNKIVLTKKQELEKQKLLLEISKDIKSLEKDIKKSSYTNIKINILKNLKLLLSLSKYAVPYLLTIGVITSLFCYINCTPFMLDKYERHIKRKKELDKYGNIRYEDQLEKFDDDINRITYFGKWEPNIDGTYSRIVEMYKLKKLNDEEIINIINSENISLKDVFKTHIPDSKITETKNNLTEEEINKGSFLQATIFSVLEDKICVVEETIKGNIVGTVIYLALLAAICGPKVENSCSKFGCDKKKIKDDYPNIDSNALKIKLEIKQKNYNRLMR